MPVHQGRQRNLPRSRSDSVMRKKIAPIQKSPIKGHVGSPSHILRPSVVLVRCYQLRPFRDRLNPVELLLSCFLCVYRMCQKMPEKKKPELAILGNHSVVTVIFPLIQKFPQAEGPARLRCSILSGRYLCFALRRTTLIA